MKAPESIEEKLNRLMPPPISESGMQQMDALLENLAQGEAKGTARNNSLRNTFAGAAKLVALLLLFLVPVALLKLTNEIVPVAPQLALLDAVAPMAAAQESEFVVIHSVHKVAGRENDGLITPVDGAAPHYRYRFHVVDEEKVRDPETGVVITLRQPRQEVITLPVTDF